MPSLIRFFTFIFLCPLTFFAQQFPSQKQADAFVTSLQQNGIDTICTFKYDCVGCVRLSQCETQEVPVHIFWKQKNKTYYTKRDNCAEYQIIKLKNDKFWELYFDNKEIISAEKIRRARYTSKDNDNNVYILEVSHYFFREISFFIRDEKKVLEKVPEYYYEKIVHSERNIDFEFNTSTLTYKLNRALNSIINKKPLDKIYNN